MVDFLQSVQGDGGAIEPDPVTLVAYGKPAGIAGSNYTDKTITALTAEQAAGREPILPANPARRALMIRPPDKSDVVITPEAPRGWLMIRDADNHLTGPNCPTNAIYITGLVAGVEVIVWEA